ncbi:MAG: prepilin-type N-terminal cleavage/methylation domain-containing protein [Sedimentisphaerales bacterium]|nr:prepilin-type N-terminal cleavage/methylation domain-containing protein [Sedimentisphaerales bacterium]
MNFDSKPYNTREKAFSLVEVMTALAILALTSSSVLVVIDRCASSAATSALKMQAFEVARENMEALLASPSVQESVDYGESDKYPAISWQTSVETFYEPVTARMWLRGVCSAQYSDPNGNEQTVELTHWLTDLSKEQLLQMMKQDGEGQDDIAGQLLESVEDAAEYAGVDVETIEKWLENGLITAEDGSFIKSNLDLFKQNNGEPSDDAKSKQIKSTAELRERLNQSGQETGGQSDGTGQVDSQTGLTYEELQQMDFSEIWNLMQNR